MTARDRPLAGITASRTTLAEYIEATGGFM